MLAASTSTCTASATHSHAEHRCTTCLVNFDSKESKRVHMRNDECHVYNLKRKIASLPPLSLEIFEREVLPSEKAKASPPFQQDDIFQEQHRRSQKSTRKHLNPPSHLQTFVAFPSQASFDSDESPSPKSTLSSTTPKDEPSREETFNPQHCLFCNFKSTSLDTNLIHMSHAHSFFIPDPSHLIDTSSFLSYLFILISEFHECLFCGSVKSSKSAVQDHMRGKGHCKVNFDDSEAPIWEFWEFGGDGDEMEEVTLVPNDEDELHLPSGKILGPRQRLHTRPFRQISSPRPSPSRLQLLTEAAFNPGTLPGPGPIESRERRIATRTNTSTSMIGVPALQLRALMAVEKKMETIEIKARNEYQSKIERGGNKQKRFRVLSMGKKAGGLEKRLG